MQVGKLGPVFIRCLGGASHWGFKPSHMTCSQTTVSGYWVTVPVGVGVGEGEGFFSICRKHALAMWLNFQQVWSGVWFEVFSVSFVRWN